MESKKPDRKRQCTKRSSNSSKRKSKSTRKSIRKSIRQNISAYHSRKIQKEIKKAQKEKTGISTYGLLKVLQYAANFIGVFAEDQLENLAIMSFPSFLIINLDPSHLNGSHWLAVRISPRSIEIFDPLGFQILNWPRVPCKLLNFLSRWSNHRQTLISPLIQSSTSVLCGYYCIAYIICRHVISFKKFLNIFKDPEQNDKLLINVFSYFLY